MAPMLDDQKCEFVKCNEIFDECDEILNECLDLFFKKNINDGTYTWTAGDFKYHLYYDDNFVLRVNRKRLRN